MNNVDRPKIRVLLSEDVGKGIVVVGPTGVYGNCRRLVDHENIIALMTNL